MKNKSTLVHIAAIVMRKSTTYLKICTALFVCSMLILSVGTILSWNQYQQIQSNFVKNVNTHVIEVSGQYQDDVLKSETFDDIEEIDELLEKRYETETFDAFPMYQFSYDLDVTGMDESIHLFAVDHDAQKFLLKEEEMEKGKIYTPKSVGSDSLTVLVPKVKMTNDGMHLSDEKEYQLEVSDAEINDIFDTYDSMGIDPYFVSYDTYAEMFQYSFDKPLNAAKKESFKDMKAIYKIFVYVHNIDCVEDMARMINEEGYLTNFVFQSFENLGEDLGASLVLLLAVAIMLTVFTLISLLMSLRAYVQLISRDIGILKQMGYTTQEVYQIYGWNLKKLFYGIAAVSSAIVGCMALAILDIGAWKYIAVHLLVMNLLLFAVYVFAKGTLLRRKCSQNVISLLKFNKDFE